MLRDIEITRTLPGTKIRLYGPIEVRRGVWLLKRSNIEIMWQNLTNKDLIPQQSFDYANQLILGQNAIEEMPD